MLGITEIMKGGERQGEQMRKEGREGGKVAVIKICVFRGLTACSWRKRTRKDGKPVEKVKIILSKW